MNNKHFLVSLRKNTLIHFTIIQALCLLFSSLVVFNAWLGFPVIGSFGSSVALGGIIPYSDAGGYYDGAYQLLMTGELNGWSMRRPLTSLLLSLRLWLTDYSFKGALIVQIGIFSVALSLLTFQIHRVFGTLSALIVLTLYSFAANISLFTTMTEPIGLTLGLLSFVLLWTGVEDSKLNYFSFGMFLLTISLNARAGPFLVIPMIFLWLSLQKPFPKLKWLSASLLAVLFGFFFNHLLIFIYAPTDLSATSSVHSNFSHVLYGLASGGKGWEYALKIFPMDSLSEYEWSSHVYRESLRLIFENPLSLIKGLILYTLAFIKNLLFPFDFLEPEPKIKNILHHIVNTHQVSPYVLQIFQCFTISLFMVFLYWLSTRKFIHYVKTNPTLGGFILSGLIGNFLSASVIWVDGGWRVFAATFAFFALFFAAAYAKKSLPINKKYSSHLGNIALFSSITLLIGALFGPKLAFKMQNKVIAPPTSRCNIDETQIFTYNLSKAPYINVSKNIDFSLNPNFKTSDFISALSPNLPIYKNLRQLLEAHDLSLGLVFDHQKKKFYLLTGPLHSFEGKEKLVIICAKPMKEYKDEFYTMVKIQPLTETRK